MGRPLGGEKLERGHGQGAGSYPDLVWEDINLARKGGGCTDVYSICDNLSPNRRALLHVVAGQVGTDPIPLFDERATTTYQALHLLPEILKGVLGML